MLGFNPLYCAVLGLMSGPQAAFSLDFMAGSTLNPSVITFSRGSNATQFDSLGRLVWAPANLTPNSECVGAAVPTTVPTSWGGLPAPANGITVQIVGTGVDSGMNYIDVRWFGASAGSTSFPGLQFSSSSFTPVRLTESYTLSLFVKKIAGSFISNQSVLQVWEGNPGYLSGSSVAINDSSVNTSSFTRLSVSRTMSNALVTHVNTNIQFTVNPTDVLDLTLRIARPQIERTSVNSPQPYFPSALAAQTYGPRFDFNPQTLAPRGLLFEESRTNSVRNSSAVGGVGGTPGIAPTNWSVSTVTGVTVTTSFGVEDGIPYMDVTYSGTNTSGADAFPTINFDTAGGTAAANGQTWTQSIYARKVAGADSEASWNTNVAGRDASQVLISGQAATAALASGSKLSTSRIVATFTFTDPLVAFAQPRFQRSTLANGAAINITIRLGYPQLEQGAFATSPIPTSGAAATRAGDVADLVSQIPYNNAGMSLYAAFEREGIQLASTTQPAVAYFGDGADAMTVLFGFGTPLQMRMDTIVASSGSLQVSQVNGLVNTVYRQAARFAPNDARLAQNGVLGTVDSAGTLPATLTSTRKSIGRGNAAASQQMNGWLQGLRVYTQALPDATLQALTA